MTIAKATSFDRDEGRKDQDRNLRSRSRPPRLLAIAGVAVASILAGAFALHFGQIRHDRLDYDVDRVFPPERAFVPGEIYATTLAEIMDHELHGGFGWRPNDLFFWGPRLLADNNANRQLGIIMAIRETLRVFKDDLTKISSNEYDPNLVVADSDFRNDPEKWALPSAEEKFEDGVAHLRDYVAGLHATPPRSRTLNQRDIELLSLFSTWTDLLGDAHAMLYATREPSGEPVRPWDADDRFYHAQGYAHVMYHMLLAVKREYHQTLTVRPVLSQLFDDTIDALRTAATLKPLVVLDGSPSGILANHRYDLDAFLSEARAKMSAIHDELQR